MSIPEYRTWGSFNSWKFGMIKLTSNLNFIRYKKSDYIIAISVFDHINTLYGIWSINENYGIEVRDYCLNLRMSKEEFTFVPTSSLSDISDIIQPSGVSLESRVFDILKTLVTSKEYAAKSPDELAIKSIKLVQATLNRVNEFTSLSKWEAT